MSRLVEDLLLLARLDSGSRPRIEPTDLTEIVINAVSDAAGRRARTTPGRLSLPEEPVVALGDRHRLHQVVANLLANARTHTPPGTRVRERGRVVTAEAVVRRDRQRSRHPARDPATRSSSGSRAPTPVGSGRKVPHRAPAPVWASPSSPPSSRLTRVG